MDNKRIKEKSSTADSRELFRLPLVRIAPFMAAGMILAYIFENLGSGGACAVIIVFAAAFAVYLFIKRSVWALCLTAFAFGLLTAGLYAALYYSPVREYEQKHIQGEFTVTEIQSISGDHQEITVKMKLGKRTVKAELTCETRLEAGQTARADIIFKEFDEENKLYAMANGILLSGSADNIEIVSSSPKAKSIMQIIREAMLGTIDETLFGEDRALAKAMLLGDDSGLSQSARERLRICGAAHFTAVSGAHFAVFGAVIMELIPKDRKRTKAVFALLFAPMAMMFFGTSVSALRAAVMFVISGCAVLFQRTSEPLNTLCAAFILLALFSPGIVLDIGFAMSVMGVFGVAVIGPRLSERLCGLLPQKVVRLSPVITAVTVSVSAVVCTAPISAAFFKGVSLPGALTSILLTPLMALSVTFLILTAVTGANILALPMAAAIKLANVIIGGLGNVRGAWLAMNFSGAWAAAAVFAVILTVGVFSDLKILKTLGSCAISMTLIAAFCFAESVYISKTRNETVIVENSRSSAEIVFADGKADVTINGSGGGLAEKISRCLRENGAVKIDTLTASDADFSGALAIRELSEMMEIGYIDTNEIAKAVLYNS